jgi:CRP-like cAMP-binding protein
LKTRSRTVIDPHEMGDIPLLRDLGGRYAEDLARMARLEERPAGAVIFRRHQDCKHIYIVLAGEVGLELPVSGQEIVEVHRVGAGELLGWSPVLGRRAMTATARAATPVRLAVLDAGQVVQLCERDPHFGTAFHRQVAVVIASRLDDVRARLAHHLPRRPIPPEGSD